jgi:hypoxanthine-guanine phosphoribosyltransferase
LVWATLEALKALEASTKDLEERVEGLEVIVEQDVLDAQKGLKLINSQLRAMMEGQLGVVLTSLNNPVKVLEGGGT